MKFVLNYNFYPSLSFITFIHYFHSLLSFITFIHYFHSLLSFITFIHYFHSLLSFITFIHYFHSLLSFITFIHFITLLPILSNLFIFHPTNRNKLSLERIKSYLRRKENNILLRFLLNSLSYLLMVLISF